MSIYGEVIIVTILYCNTANQSNMVGDNIWKGRGQISYWFSIG